MAPGDRVRQNIWDLQDEHHKSREAQKKELTELDVLVKAFARIMSLGPDDRDSFQVIAGYHGVPFRGLSPSIFAQAPSTLNNMTYRLIGVTVIGGEDTASMDRSSFPPGIEPTT